MKLASSRKMTHRTTRRGTTVDSCGIYDSRLNRIADEILMRLRLKSRWMLLIHLYTHNLQWSDYTIVSVWDVYEMLCGILQVEREMIDSRPSDRIRIPRGSQHDPHQPGNSHP